MQTLFFFITSIFASVIAVKIISTYLKAGKVDWLSSVIAVFLSVIVLNAVAYLIPMQLAGLVVSVLVVGFVLESILETSFAKGMMIAAVAIVVQWLIKYGFTSLGVTTDVVSFIEQIL